MPSNLPKAVAAGIAGTLAMTAVGVFVGEGAPAVSFATA